MKLATTLKWAAPASVVFCAVTRPGHVADTTINVGHFIASSASGLSHFVTSI